MTWIKLDDAYPEHRKLKRAGELRAFCVALDVAGMCFCGRFNTDGFICDDDLPGVLEIIPGHQQQLVLAALVRIGRWERDDDHSGYWVHGYLNYNPSAARREQIAKAGRERAQASRERRSRERSPNAQRTDGEASPHVQRDSRVRAATPSPSPSPSPSVLTSVPTFTGVGDMPPVDNPVDSNRREGKGRKPSRPRHRSDAFVIQRAREIRDAQGPDAARAYLRTVDETFGQASREQQLAMLEAKMAQDAAAEATQTAHANLDDVIFDDDRPVHDVGTQGGRL